MNRQSQTSRLLSYLEDGGTISSAQAFSRFGITSLHRRLSDIKAMGHTIDSEWVDVRKTHFKRYWIVSDVKKAA